MTTDIGLVIAIVGSGVAIVGVMICLFLWNRSEANADRRNFLDIQSQDRKDLLQITKNIETVMNAIQYEMKDFHYKLLEIQKKVL